MTAPAKCAACKGVGCRDCRRTGRRQVPCPACLGRSWRECQDCIHCHGFGKLDPVNHASVIAAQQSRCA